MKKIRINELARELEVKAHEILERLPELGVTEKKTHSSSIDEDVAIKLRQYYGQDVPDYVHDPNAVDEPVVEAPEERHSGVHEDRHTEAREPAPPAAVDHGRATTPYVPPPAPAPESAPAAKEEHPAPHEAPRPVAPIRPPWAGGRPIHPPVGVTSPPRAEAPRPAPLAPAGVSSSQPAARPPSAPAPSAPASSLAAPPARPEP